MYMYTYSVYGPHRPNMSCTNEQDVYMYMYTCVLYTCTCTSILDHVVYSCVYMYMYIVGMIVKTQELICYRHSNHLSKHHIVSRIRAWY